MRLNRHRLSRDPRSGIYYVKVQTDKIRKRFAFGKNRKEAESLLRKLERDLMAGKVCIESPHQQVEAALPSLPPDGWKLGALIQRHLDWVQNNRSAGTCQVRCHFLNNFLKFVGDCRVEEINRLMLENFFAWARKCHGHGPNGGNAYLRHVKTMFLWAEEMGLCDCPVKRFPQAPETLPLTRRFSDEELSRLFQQTSPAYDDFRDMILFGLLTGLRPQELRLLEKQHIMKDAQDGLFIFIERHKTARSARKPISRSVPLTGEAVEIFKRRMLSHPESSFLFLNADGQPYKPRSFRQRFIRWCSRVGVKPRPPYALRHTFGSMEAEANINQTSLSQIMGHTTIRTTSRYISNNYDHHRTAVNAISGRVSALKPAPALSILENPA